MHSKNTPFKKCVSLATVLFHLCTISGLLDALRIGAVRLHLGSSAVFAQGSPQRSIEFVPGLNLFSLPVTVSSSTDSCFELLSVLGGASAVQSISRFNTTTQLFEVCAYSGATAAGENFSIRDGEGYQVRMKADKTVLFNGAAVCPALNLKKGTNLIGVPSPFAGLSCFDLLEALGAEKISTSQGYDKDLGAFEACTFANGSTPAGDDFPIVAGEAYLVSMRQDFASFNLNDPAACLGDRPPVLSPIGHKIVNLGTTLVFSVVGSDPDCPSSSEDCDPADVEKDKVILQVAPLPLPRNATFNQSNGKFTFTPDDDQVGDFSLTFSATDSRLTANETITLTVVRPAPGATALSGRLLDTNAYVLGVETPIVGATVSLLGTGRSTTSGPDGQFLLSDLPAGSQVLDIATATANLAPDGSPYSGFREAIQLLEGVTNFAERPFFLPRLDRSSLTPVNPNNTTVVNNPNLNITLTVPPHTAKNADGTDFTGNLSISLVPAGLAPAALPDELQPGLLITIQPVGVRFDTPVPITFPNIDHLPPGSEVDIWSLDPEEGVFVVVGTGRVSANGQLIQTISGGVRAADWHFPMPPEPEPDDGDDDNKCCNSGCPCSSAGSGSDTTLGSGSLVEEHKLVSYRALGQSRSLRLVYRSLAADPQPILSSNTTLRARAALPPTVSASVSVVGLDQGVAVYTSTNGLSESVDETFRHALQFDASALPTGSYPYQLTVTSHYAQSAISAVRSGTVSVNNLRDSVYGAGWDLAGVQRLHRAVTGDLVLTNGAGMLVSFTPATRVSAEIHQAGERDLYHFVGNKDELVTLRMLRLPNQPDGASSLDPVIELRDSRGFLLARDDESGSSTPPGPGSNAQLLAFKLPATDTYVVSARGKGGSSGPYQLLLTTVADSQLISGQISPPKPVNPAFAFNGSIATAVERDSYTFVANAGARVTIAVNRRANNPDGTSTLDPEVELRDSRNVLIATDNDTGTNAPVGPGRNALIVNRQLAATDTYTVTVVGHTQTTGPYDVNILFDQFTGNVQAGGGGPTVIDAVAATPEGEFSTMVINEDGTITRRMPDGVTSLFTSTGLHTSTTDRNGNRTTYQYDAQQRLISMTDPVGLVTTLTYGAGGKLAEIRDPAGRVTRFEHDAQGNLQRIIDPDSSARQFTYDARHRLLSQTSKRGFTTTYEYNFAGRHVKSNWPDTSTRRIASIEVVGLIDPASGLGTQNNPVPVVRPEAVVATFTDGNGNVTTYRTDAFGIITEETDALGRTTVTDRDANGLVTRRQRPNGAVLRYTYDENANLLTRTEEAINATTSYTYDPLFSQMTRLTDPEGRETTIILDAQGNPVQITDAEGTVTKLLYDEPSRNPSAARGLLTSIVRAFGAPTLQNIIGFAYDQRGNLAEVIDPLNRRTALSYDTAGNIDQRMDAEGRVTDFAYDLLNRLMQVTDAAQPVRGVSEYNYDAEGNLLTVTDARGKTTTWSYDSRNRVTGRTDPLSRTETFEYDLNGNLRFVNDRKGQRIELRYDVVDQLTKKILPDNLVTDYGYDQVGNLVTAADSDSALTMTYDLANRLLSNSTAGSSQQPSVTVSYTYDKVGNRKTMTDPTGATAYLYDDVNRLLSLTDPSTQAITFAYDVLHRRTDAVFPNGTTTRFAYDVADQLTSLIHQLGATPFSSFNYTYNKVGNRTAIDVERTAVSATNNLSYSYDSLDRLVQATRPLTGLPDETFTYDSVGNRLQRDGQAMNASFDNVNQLLEDAEFTYTYDANGNLTEKQSKATGARIQYVYDAENRLVQVQEVPSGGGPATKTVTYRYDAFGRRIEKNVDGVITRFVYDQEDILLEFDGANSMVARYTHGNGIDEPLVMTRNGQRFFYHANELGSITEISDAAGAVAQAYVYDSFGKIQASRVPLASFANFYTYTGREFDAETGLYFYRARFYEPGVGRFLQEDPFKGILSLPLSLNPYLYVTSNPGNLIDPSGFYLLYVVAGIASLIVVTNILDGINTWYDYYENISPNPKPDTPPANQTNAVNNNGGCVIINSPGASCVPPNTPPAPPPGDSGGSGNGSGSGSQCHNPPDSPPEDKPQPTPSPGGGSPRDPFSDGIWV